MVRFTTTARFGFALALASGFLTLTPPAFAANDVPQAMLNAAGIDFSSAKAVTHVQNQVRRIALQICAPDWDYQGPLAPDRRKCIDTAVHNGFAQIASKRMDALRRTTVDMAAAQLEENPTH